MNRKRCILSLAVALASTLSLPLRSGADSLVTVDGAMLVGRVTKTASGYTVLTSDGPVDVPADRVKKVLYDHPPAEAPVTPASRSTGTSAAKPKAVDSRMIDTLIEQGEAAMSAAQYTDARDAFKDALSLDKQNALAARGLGFAYLALSKPAKALDPLEIAAQKPPLDRSMVMGIASALVTNHNSMRAVRYLTPYLQAHSSPVDEPMLNALGIALSQADNSAKKSQLYKDAGKLYRKLNTDLEATVDGKRRWGVEWLAKADVADKEKVRGKAQQKADDAYNKLMTAQNEQASAQAELNGAAVALGRRNQATINNAEAKLQQANQEVNKAQGVYDAAAKELADLPTPTFPATIVVDDADLIVAPGAIASAATATPAVKPDAPIPTEIKPSNGTGEVESPAPKPVVPRKKPPKPVQTPADTDEPPAAAPAPRNPAAARHVTRYAVGFLIAPDVLVTAASAVEDSTNISVTLTDGRSLPATLLRAHHGDGLALLKLDNASLPCVALATAGNGGALSCFGFPEVDLFNPVPRNMDLSADPQTDDWKVHFTVSPRLPGGPIFQDGKVVGVELGDRDGDPASIPAATLKQLTELVADSANAATVSPDPKKAIVQVSAER